MIDPVIDRETWVLLAERMAVIRAARAEVEAHAEPARLDFDAYDQAVTCERILAVTDLTGHKHGCPYLFFDQGDCTCGYPVCPKCGEPWVPCVLRDGSPTHRCFNSACAYWERDGD